MKKNNLLKQNVLKISLKLNKKTNNMNSYYKNMKNTLQKIKVRSI